MDLYTAADVLALKWVPGAGNVAVRLILECLRRHDAPLKTLLGKPLAELISFFPSGQERLAEVLHACDARLQKRAAALIGKLEQASVLPVLCGTPAYPAVLESHLGKAAPVLFFAQGNISLLYQAAAGIVGTRTPSRKGVCLARECARVFAARGIPVVSGGARGVDTAAHEAALEAAGSTLLILPQGILTFRASPRYETALSDGALLLISEFAPEAEWQTHAAVTRNATISALSRLIMVIEPRSVNGSLRTARHAVEQGKPVFYHGLGPAARSLAHCPNTHPLTPVNPAVLLAAFHRPCARPTPQNTLF